MEKETKKRLMIDLATGVVISVAVFLLQENRGYEISRCLSDAFFVAAVILMGVGGIGLAVNKGNFDVPGYGISHMFSVHFPNAHKDEDIYEYKERKLKERKSPKPLLVSGFFFLVLAVVFTAVFYIKGNA